jgi:hypothetical protein
MQPMEWIRFACEHADDANEVYSRYNEFLDSTGSEMKLSTFKRRVRELFYDVSGHNYAPTINTDSGKILTPRIMTEADGPNMSIVSRSHKIRTLEQLLAYTRTDMSRWKVRKHTINPWGSEANENFQVKAELVAKELGEDARNDVLAMLNDAAQYMPNYEGFEVIPVKFGESSGNLVI